MSGEVSHADEAVWRALVRRTVWLLTPACPGKLTLLDVTVGIYNHIISSNSGQRAVKNQYLHWIKYQQEKEITISDAATHHQRITGVLNVIVSFDQYFSIYILYNEYYLFARGRFNNNVIDSTIAIVYVWFYVTIILYVIWA